MTATEADILGIQEKIKPLLGKVAWDVYRSTGTFITLEFGAALPPDEAGNVMGEWHFQVEGCMWRLETPDQVLAGSQDQEDKLEAAFRSLQDRVLLSIEVSPPALETTMTFEGDLTLRLFPVTSKSHYHWLLFTPEERVLALGPGTTWSYDDQSDD